MEQQHIVLSPNLLFTKLQKLTTINDQLKVTDIQQSINPPRIMVIGTQSAGKSSVLESIIGLDFLPKGDGVVTRRPTEITLKHLSSSNGEEDPKPYAEFPMERDGKYYDFQQVKDKISELMNQTKRIIDHPIIVHIFSPHCPNFFLVDLPGIITVPGCWDLDLTNIEQITKETTRRYAQDPRSIILCVIPANQDLENYPPLQTAIKADPLGRRTIGVITKIDIMDKGTNAKSILLNKERPLKLGYVGLKGRSQRDLQNGMKVIDGIKMENEFFASHPVYSTLPSGSVGTEAAIQKLSEVIFADIRKMTVPYICDDIRYEISKWEEELEELNLCNDEDDELKKKETLKVTLNNNSDLIPSPLDDLFWEEFKKVQEPKPLEPKKGFIMGQHTGCSSNLLFRKLQKLTTINSQLREAGIQQSIQPPRIMVSGAPSTGKSSVLESIIGLDFLPKGDGVVTRRPIEITLKHLSSSSILEKITYYNTPVSSDEGEDPHSPYAEFPKEGNTKFHDFQQVLDRISDLMNKVEDKRDVLDDPIAINIYSPEYPDLTLVDLPGIFRAPSTDPFHLEIKTKEICRRYAKDPNTIILCVIDEKRYLNACPALRMAIEQDPLQTQSIGVITKVDMMERGTDAKRIILGQEHPLRWGFIGLKGRSQQDLQNGVKIAEGLKTEKEYFESHPVYSRLPSRFVGTKALIRKLCKVIFTYIRKTIREVCKEIQTKTTECDQKLKDLALSQDQNEQIIAEKESLNRTLEILKNLKFALNNDPDFAPNPQDEHFFKALERATESPKDEMKELKPKDKSLFGESFQPPKKNDNPFAPKSQGKESPLKKSTEQDRNYPFAPKKGLFG